MTGEQAVALLGLLVIVVIAVSFKLGQRRRKVSKKSRGSQRHAPQKSLDSRAGARKRRRR